jgi:hypothetical protein
MSIFFMKGKKISSLCWKALCDVYPRFLPGERYAVKAKPGAISFCNQTTILTVVSCQKRQVNDLMHDIVLVICPAKDMLWKITRRPTGLSHWRFLNTIISVLM